MIEHIVGDFPGQAQHFSDRGQTIGRMFMRNVALPFDKYYQARRARGESGQQTFSKTL